MASGPSLHGVDLNKLATTGAQIIAVNGAADFLPVFDHFFTLDLSPANMDRIKRKEPATTYHCAQDEQDLDRIPSHVHRYVRVSEPDRSRMRDYPKGSDEWFFHRWGCKPGLSEDPWRIHSGNSAYGALGLAYHWNPVKILLLGVDGTNEDRMNGEGRPKYSIGHLPILFDTARHQIVTKGIEVMNGSPNSRVNTFRKITPKEGIRWIQQP